MDGGCPGRILKSASLKHNLKVLPFETALSFMGVMEKNYQNSVGMAGLQGEILMSLRKQITTEITNTTEQSFSSDANGCVPIHFSHIFSHPFFPYSFHNTSPLVKILNLTTPVGLFFVYAFVFQKVSFGPVFGPNCCKHFYFDPCLLRSPLIISSCV
jgi:hypothetical protein